MTQQLVRMMRGVAILAISAILLACEPTVVFTTDTSDINAGDPVTLSWNVAPQANTTLKSIVISPDVGDVAAAGTMVVNPFQTTTYSLVATAVNAKGEEFAAESIVTITVKGLCEVDDITGMQPQGRLAISAVSDIEPLCSGWVLVGNTQSSTIDNLHVGTGDLMTSYPLEATPKVLELDANAGLLYVGHFPATFLSVVNLYTGDVQKVQLLGPVRDIAIHSPGKAFVSIGTDSYVVSDIGFIDGKNAEVIATMPVPRIGVLIDYDKQNGMLFSGNVGLSGSTLMRLSFNEADRTLLIEERISSGANGQDLVVSPVGGHVAYPNGGGNGPGYTIYDYDTGDLSNVMGEFNVGAYPTSADFSPDGKYLAATNRYDVVLFDVSNKSIVQESVDIPRCAYATGDRIRYSLGGEIVVVSRSCNFDRDAGELYFLLVKPPLS